MNSTLDISATELVRNFSHYIQIVSSQKKPLRILKSKKPIATIVPSKKNGASIADCKSFFFQLSFSQKEQESFTSDIKKVKNTAHSVAENPWQ